MTNFFNEQIKQISNLPNWHVAVAAGEIPGAFFVNKFGENSAISSLATIWDAGGLYEYIQTAQQLSIQSDNVDDTLLGTGARTLSVSGLNENYELITDIIELNGTTPVITSSNFIRVFRMKILTGGTTGGAIGTVTAKIGATTYAQIINGNNQTLMALFTVPAGKTAFILMGKSSSGKGKDVTGSFFARPDGGVFNLQHRFFQFETNYDFPFFPAAAMLPEKTDLEVRATADVSTAVSAAFNLLIVDN